MWENQAGKFMTSKKVNIDLLLPEFSATKIMTWKCLVDESTNSRYDMILVRYLLNTMVLDLKFTENVIIGGKIPHEGCLAPMVDLKITTLHLYLL